MKIYYDCEFLEDGHTIELISIGLVAEDGREYYAVDQDLPVKRIRKNQWLMDNVVPSLPMIHGDQRNHIHARDELDLIDYAHPDVKHRGFIAGEVATFIRNTPDVELWADYGAYDHVVLAQLFGRMIDLPDGIPMYTNDLQQEARRLVNAGVRNARGLPAQESGHHNALADARHNMVIGRYLERLADNPHAGGTVSP